MQSESKQSKRCRRCDRDQPLEEFTSDPRMADGLRTNCRTCNRINSRARYHRAPVRQRREWDLLKNHGLTHDEYDALLERQGGGCGICGTAVDGYLVVDHDHASGRVRGLLCVGCNGALGRFGDSLEGLERACAYLRGHDAA